jgi:hypothetical protein
MRRPRLACLIGVALLAALLAAPAGVLAADSVTVTGTVVRGGEPQVGVAVTVTVASGDTVATANTDEAGAFSVDIEAAMGSEVRVNATGQETRSGPDGNGCIHSETPIGSASEIIDAIPPAPLEVPLDQVRTSTACTATGAPQITPPATDVLRATPSGSTSGGGLLVVLGLLALLGSGSLALARRRA